MIASGECGNTRDPPGSVVMWAFSTKPGQMVVEVYPAGHPDEAMSFEGPEVTAATGQAGKMFIRELETGTKYHYHSYVGDHVSNRGTFKTAYGPDEETSFSLVWAASLGGQGWGLSSELEIECEFGDKVEGGYVTLGCAIQLEPDYVMTAGDMVYADVPINAEQEISDENGGGVWMNDLAYKPFVAQSLNEFRRNWQYNMLDKSWRGMLEDRAVYCEWNDHEVTDNWYPGEILPEGEPYFGASVDALARRGRRGFFENTPIHNLQPIWKSYRHGKHAELWTLDLRSYRDSNPANGLPEPSTMLGAEQLEWFKETLKNSTATWKIIGNHNPISIVTGGEDDWDSWSSGTSELTGREHELAEILTFIKDEGIKNVVFITSGVDHAAAYYYSPDHAVYQEFNGFYEFISGPTHSGAFGPSEVVDPTFGPIELFVEASGTLGFGPNAPPTIGHTIGYLEVSDKGLLDVQILRADGTLIYQTVLAPEL